MSIPDKHLDRFSAAELLAAQLFAGEPEAGCGPRRTAAIAREVAEAASASGWEKWPKEETLRLWLKQDTPKARDFRQLIADFRPEVRRLKREAIQENVAVEMGRRLTTEQVRSALLARAWAAANITHSDLFNADGEQIPVYMLPPEKQLAFPVKGASSYEAALKLLQRQVQLDQGSETGETAISEAGMVDETPVPDHLLNPKGAESPMH